MRNFLLLCFSMTLSLFLGEAVLRVALRWIPIDIMEAPTVISERGYTLNPSFGNIWHQVEKRIVEYHYYPPHLRDTPVNLAAQHILVLGDSFTFGWLLPWNHTFVYHLQRFANKTFGKEKYQFLDAGTGGWGAADYLSYLEQYGAKTSPRYVIIFLNTDDIGRAIKRNIYTLKNSSLLYLENNFHPIPREQIKKIIYDTWLFQHSILLHFIRFGVSRLLHINSKHLDDTSEIDGHVIPTSQNLSFTNEFAVHYGEALFLRINQWCIKHHAKLLVVTTGFDAFYPANLHDPTKAFLAEAPDFFSKKHILFYDSATPFKKLVAGKNFQISGDQHPNKVGALAIAQASWPWIKKKFFEKKTVSISGYHIYDTI